MTESKPKPPRRTFVQRAKGLALRLLVLALTIEGSSWLALFVLKGPESFSELRERQKSLATLGIETEAPTVAATGTVLHPFLGFVTNFEANSAWPVKEIGHPINLFGFIDKSHPLQKRAEDRLIVLITGGSVAGGIGIAAESVFQEAFAADPRFAGKELVMVRMAVGGYKQPQQLMALLYHMALGGEFDVVINIDGFNEVALGLANSRLGTTPIFPRDWPLQVAKVPDLEHQKSLGRLAGLREDRQLLAKGAQANPLRFLGMAKVLWFLRDQEKRAQIGPLSERVQAYAPAALDYEARGIGNGGLNDDAILDLIAAHWRECSLLLHDLCKARGMRYFHVLQPNQYVAGSKPIGAEEAKVALAPNSPYAKAVAAGYPKLVQESEKLAQAGVNIFDLRFVFQGIEEPIYNDSCCHFNQRGSEVMTRELMRRLLAAW